MLTSVLLVVLLHPVGKHYNQNYSNGMLFPSSFLCVDSKQLNHWRSLQPHWDATLLLPGIPAHGHTYTHCSVSQWFC